MTSLDLWAHIAAAVGFLMLVAWVVDLQRRAILIGELLGYPNKVIVAEPLTVLKKITRALNISLNEQIDSSYRSAGPVKVNLSEIGEIFVGQNIKGISVQSNDDIILVQLEGCKGISEAEKVQFSRAFANRIQIML